MIESTLIDPANDPVPVAGQIGRDIFVAVGLDTWKR